MDHAQFWTVKDKRESILDKINKSSDPLGENIMNNNDKNKKIIKGLGITGIVLVVIALIVAGLSYKFVIKPAYALMASANVLKKDTADIADSLKNRDLVTLEETLQRTEKDLTDIKNEREDSFGWVKDMNMFRVNEFYADSERFINAGFYAVDAIREVSNVVTPFADAAGLKVSADQEVVETEGLMEAFQGWISIMPEVANQMDGVIEKVAKVGEELEPIDVSKYPEEFKGIAVRDNVKFVKNTLSKANDYAPDVKQALLILPRVLGVGAEQELRYMIIMQNDKELRPTGGFMTNYATFKMFNAELKSDFTSKDMYSVDDTLDLIDAAYDFPDPPEAYMKYLKVERWYARDMNASPDFVQSMDQFLEYYNIAGQLAPAVHKSVDGIFSMDTYVVEELLRATGPVTVNGITYTEDNVVLELEKIASLELREQLHRKKVLGDLMESMLINVFESDKNLWPKLIDKAIDLAVRKHIQVYLFDEEAQALVEKYDFGGRIDKEVEGDYAAVISTNLGGDKTNWFVKKDVTHVLEKEGNSLMRTVKIKYSYIEPNGDYGPFIKRFRDWVRVYVPAGSQVVSVEGSEDESVNAIDEYLNKFYMTGFLELGPGEEKELVFKYRLPSSVVKGDEYVLKLQKQSGIDREMHTVKVNDKTVEVDLYRDTEVKIKL
ncbi:DUF4012 domain-containing protein [Patescibacteria group bacterium]|nr:DUF4012 domain-containing protein [Patescibacteria group bacterium]